MAISHFSSPTLSVPEGRREFQVRVRAVWEGLEAVTKASEFTNVEGGSVEQHNDKRLRLHHCANYAAALSVLAERGESLSILELGCGSGALSSAFARLMPQGWRLVATDYSGRLLEHARRHHRRSNLEFERLDARTIEPDRLSGFSAVLLVELIEHLPAPEAARLVLRLYRAIGPGAVILITTLDRTPFARPFSGYAPHAVEYSYDSLVRFLFGLTRHGLGPFSVYRLASPRIAAEVVAAEESGGYLVNRLQRLVLGLAKGHPALDSMRALATTLLYRVYAVLPQADGFDLDAYLDSVEFVREQAWLRDDDSFGLVAVLEKQEDARDRSNG